MRTFLKFFFLSVAAQVLVGGLLLLMGVGSPFISSLADSFLEIYSPTLNFIDRNSRPGESAMIGVPLIGIPLGVVLYSLIVALIAWWIKKR